MKKIFFIVIASIAVLLLSFVWQYHQLYDGKLHISVCDVGQGDALFIQTPERRTILIDGGPDNRVLSCLFQHVPFWHRHINLVILTHPHADHMMGLLDVMQYFDIDAFGTEKLANTTLGYQQIQKTLSQKHIPIQYLTRGSILQEEEGVTLSIIGPSQAFLEETSPHGTIGESSEFGSVETLLSYGQFRMLFTGDSQADELMDASELPRVTVLQVPHHGSKTGLSEKLISILHPSLAVISVGKNNKYGHPAPETLDLLKKWHIPFLRTDMQGTINITADTTSWYDTFTGQ